MKTKQGFNLRMPMCNIYCIFIKKTINIEVGFSFNPQVHVPMVKFILWNFLLSSFFCQALCAQTSHTLADALALTLLNNSELSSFNYDIRASEARILQAGFRPNPALDTETENLGAPIFMQTTLLLSQLIELGGKRNARLKLSKTERDRVTLEYEVRKRQLFVDTTLLFIDVLTSQQKIAFYEKNLKNLQGFSTIVDKRIKAGKASVIEESNFTILLTTAMIDLKNAHNDLKTAKNKLSAQWNDTNSGAYMVDGDLDWTAEVISLEEMGGLIQEHPQIVLSYFEDNIRTARVALEKSKAYPDLNLRGGPRYLNEAKKWVWVVGFYIPIPVSDRNQGRIWEAYENLEKLEKEREVIWTKLYTELNNSYSTIQTVFSELNLLKNIVLPAAQRAYNFSYK
ncbi:MAG: TolC family protein [Parachlamydiaceae bacterium]|nr:TolC family protein [Parachlamydiaceae bacterium]